MDKFESICIDIVKFIITRKFSRDVEEVLPIHKPEADIDIKIRNNMVKYLKDGSRGMV
jgi:hypothetical protein